MILIEDFIFKDSNGQSWEAPKGWKIDGSSIPAVFWGTIIGSPYVGKHRFASIVHDYYVDEKNINRNDKQWKDVHRIYYYGIRASGVSSVKAKLMYWAVYLGGPRWESIAPSCNNACHTVDSEGNEVVETRVIFNADEVLEIRKWIEAEDPSIEEIENRLNSVVNTPPPHSGMRKKLENSKKELGKLFGNL